MKGEWVKRGSATAPIVVFVHGILSDGECWRHANGAYWPDIVAQDPQLADVGIYVFTYRTGFFSGSYRLADAVDALKEHLALDGITGATGIVFVCHSMGGIVVRRYLVSRATELIERQARIALFLVASPSLGSDYANWLKPIAMVLGHAQGDALRFVRSNVWLADLDRDFLNLKEQGRLPLVGKELIEDQFIVLPRLWRKQVVEPFSGARYFGEPYKVPGSDHFSIARIENAQSIQHRQLERFISIWREPKTSAAEQDNIRARSDQPLVGATAQSDAPPIGLRGWASYREQLSARTTRHDWWTQPISLQGRFTGGDSRAARDLVRDWIETRGEQHCILLGEPGAGKTGLLAWAASTLTAREHSFALWVSAKQLQDLSAIDLSALLSRAEPRPPVNTVDGFGGHEVFLMLDGLDELVGASQGGETRAGVLLRQTLACLPKTWRVLASCRAPTFEALRATVMEALPRATQSSAESDQYDAAISRALGIDGASAITIEISRVNTRAAIDYLEHSALPKEVLEGLFADEKWRQLLTSPFLLRLARVALPTLIENGAPSLDRLYQAYVRASLFREKGDLRESEVDDILEDLTQFSNFMSADRVLRAPDLPLRADLVRRKASAYDYTHYSLWEFFFARQLFTEITKLSARTLARVDLIAGYNINRMLIPMMLRQIKASKFEQSREPRLVTPDEYLEFLKKTKWRRTVGYGLHPARSREGAKVQPATFKFNNDEAMAVHRSTQHGNGTSPVASAISWYDAAAFCLYNNVRVPTKVELLHLRPEGDRLLWSSQWFNESASQMAVYDMTAGEVHGLNPDVRLPRTALAVVDLG